MPESSPNYIGRLAPSPTGLLHLGHARTFWTAFTRARAAGGELWLREEDLDPQRSRAEFSAAMREDLRWLGIAWDAELRQSERHALYRNALQQLLAAGLAYLCTCSRRDLAQSIAAPHDEDDEPIYNGHCRPMSSEPWTLSPKPSLSTNYRFRIPTTDPSLSPTSTPARRTSSPLSTSATFCSGVRTTCPAINLRVSSTTLP
jgi:glutamyl-tRNA synthetase